MRMSGSTKIHDAKKRANQKIAARKNEMYARAVKGIKPAIAIDLEMPNSAVMILEAYLIRLEVLRDDLEAEFGNLPEFSGGSSWLRMEIRLVLEAIVRLRIKIEASGG